MRVFGRRIAALVAAIAIAAGPAAANVLDDVAAARSALEAATTDKERLAAYGLAAKAQEAALAALRDDLRALSLRKSQMTEAIAAEERRLAAVLAAIQRIESAPRAAAIAHQSGVVAGARAAIALAAFAPAMEIEAARLRIVLDEMTEVSELSDISASEARAALAALNGARSEAARLYDKRRRAERPAASEVEAARRASIEALAAAEASLRDLAEATRGASPAPGAGAPSLAAMKGRIPAPVEGRIARDFAAQTPGGPLEGVEIETAAYAEVYAPVRGVVRFAGEYGGYGRVVILEPESESLIVFAGLGETLVETDDAVLAGRSLGAMGGPTPDAEEFLITSTSAVEVTPKETLYMEIRVKGEPVDPAQWFVLDTGKR